jgi:hypothetical protein
MEREMWQSPLLEESSTKIEDLPDDVLRLIMCRMDLPTLGNFAGTHRRAQSIMNDPAFRQLCILPRFEAVLGDITWDVKKNNAENSVSVKGTTPDNIEYAIILFLPNLSEEEREFYVRNEMSDKISQSEKEREEFVFPDYYVDGQMTIFVLTEDPSSPIDERTAGVMVEALRFAIMLWTTNVTFSSNVRVKYFLDVQIRSMTQPVMSSLHGIIVDSPSLLIQGLAEVIDSFNQKRTLPKFSSS